MIASRTPAWDKLLQVFGADLNKRLNPLCGDGREYLTRWLACLVQARPAPYLFIHGPSREFSALFWRAAQLLTTPAIKLDQLLTPGTIYNEDLSWATLAVVDDTDFSEVEDVSQVKLRLLVTSPYLSIYSKTEPASVVPNKLHFIQVAKCRDHAPYTVPVTFCYVEPCLPLDPDKFLQPLASEASRLREALNYAPSLSLPVLG